MPNNPDLKLPWSLPLGLLITVFVTACIAGDAMAGPDLSGISVGELGQVQSETIMFNARAERAKAERSVGSGDSNSDQVVSSPTQIPIGATGLVSTPAPADLRYQELPVIKAITGSTNKLRATLLYRSGIEVEATAGSRDLPGNFRVAQISLEGVILEGSGGKRFLLGFSDRAPGVSQATTPTPPAMPGLAPGSY